MAELGTFECVRSRGIPKYITTVLMKGEHHYEQNEWQSHKNLEWLKKSTYDKWQQISLWGLHGPESVGWGLNERRSCNCSLRENVKFNNFFYEI